MAFESEAVLNFNLKPYKLQNSIKCKDIISLYVLNIIKYDKNLNAENKNKN